MKETFKFEKTFGPVASFSGYVILITGLITTYFSLTGLILVLFGAFIGLTNSCTTIDYSNGKAKFSNNLFGVIKTGKWLDLSESMRLGIMKSHKTYRTYSKSNRILDISASQIKIYLFDSYGNTIMPLKNIDAADNLEKELEELNKKIGLRIMK
ncbi:MAG TPA: hypothetical protein PK908_03790 [Bacteroidales bacterium]|jgi:hypothetical protein|nr:hypothetical protein [Bacteroidales bacterium]